MDSPAPSLSHESATFWALRVNVLCWLSLVIWDMAVTLPVEIRHVWRAKWSLIKSFFLLNRSWTLASLSIEAYLALGKISPDLCNRVFLFTPIAAFLITLFCSCISTIRVYAIYNRDRRILAALLLGLFASTGVQASLIARASPLSLPAPVKQAIDFFGCLAVAKTGESESALLFVWVAALLFDSLVLFLTAWRHSALKRRSGGIGVPVMRQVVARHLVYFSAIFAAKVINVVFFALRDPALRTLNAPMQLVLSSLLTSRLVLWLFSRDKAAQAVNGSRGATATLLNGGSGGGPRPESVASAASSMVIVPLTEDDHRRTTLDRDAGKGEKATSMVEHSNGSRHHVVTISLGPDLSKPLPPTRSLRPLLLSSNTSIASTASTSSSLSTSNSYPKPPPHARSTDPRATRHVYSRSLPIRHTPSVLPHPDPSRPDPMPSLLSQASSSANARAGTGTHSDGRAGALMIPEIYPSTPLTFTDSFFFSNQFPPFSGSPFPDEGDEPGPDRRGRGTGDIGEMRGRVPSVSSSTGSGDRGPTSVRHRISIGESITRVDDDDDDGGEEHYSRFYRSRVPPPPCRSGPPTMTTSSSTATTMTSPGGGEGGGGDGRDDHRDDGSNASLRSMSMSLASYRTHDRSASSKYAYTNAVYSAYDGNDDASYDVNDDLGQRRNKYNRYSAPARAGAGGGGGGDRSGSFDDASSMNSSSLFIGYPTPVDDDDDDDEDDDAQDDVDTSSESSIDGTGQFEDDDDDQEEEHARRRGYGRVEGTRHHVVVIGDGSARPTWPTSHPDHLRRRSSVVSKEGAGPGPDPGRVYEKGHGRGRGTSVDLGYGAVAAAGGGIPPRQGVAGTSSGRLGSRRATLQVVVCD
ncbi:hypothetical protein JCM10212_004342 [Sporobolomyces blumeae]